MALVVVVSKQDEGIRFVVGRLKGQTTTTVQTIIFLKRFNWTEQRAKAWLRRNDFKSSKKDETSTSFRFRQREPSEFQDGTLRTIRPGRRRARRSGADPSVADFPLRNPTQGPIPACPEGQVYDAATGRCVQRQKEKDKESKTEVERVTRSVRIQKIDEDQRLVFGEVYAPFVPDTEGDFMTDVEIQKMAHGFMIGRKQKKVDEQHDNEETGAVIVESFISREGDPDFPIVGAWVVGAFIPNEEQWEKVKRGELNGFSMEALVTKRVRDVIVELEEEIRVTTLPGPDDHTHEATLNFDTNGNFLGGTTNVVDGHWHTVTRNTVTGPEINVDGSQSDGHRHRYSFLEHVMVIADEV